MKNIRIAYLCNQKRACNSSLFCGKECKHTLDIQYAKNFSRAYEDEAVCKYIETDGLIEDATCKDCLQVQTEIGGQTYGY